MDLSKFLRDVPDFPKPGILFKDITPLLASPQALREAVRRFAALDFGAVDKVAAIESRGFLFGAPLAREWRVPLVPVRKFGKLPGKTVREKYSLEYGEDVLEIQADALRTGQRTVIVDDLLATGGTAAATAALVGQLGGNVTALMFVVELAGLGGREKLAGHTVHALIRYELG